MRVSSTNPHNLANTAGSLMHRSTSDHTIKNYIDYLEDAYLFVGAKRYDVKGKKYFENTQKYYVQAMGRRRWHHLYGRNSIFTGE